MFVLVLLLVLSASGNDRVIGSVCFKVHDTVGANVNDTVRVNANGCVRDLKL